MSNIKNSEGRRDLEGMTRSGGGWRGQASGVGTVDVYVGSQSHPTSDSTSRYRNEQGMILTDR